MLRKLGNEKGETVYSSSITVIVSVSTGLSALSKLILIDPGDCN